MSRNQDKTKYVKKTQKDIAPKTESNLTFQVFQDHLFLFAFDSYDDRPDQDAIYTLACKIVKCCFKIKGEAAKQNPDLKLIREEFNQVLALTGYSAMELGIDLDRLAIDSMKAVEDKYLREQT